MAIKNVWITDDCTLCEACVAICPEVFIPGEEKTEIKSTDFSKHEEEIKEAAESCPVEAIQFEES